MKILLAFIPLVLVMGLSATAQEVEWVTRPDQGPPSVRGESRRPAVSENGRFIVFQTKGALLGSDQDNYWDLYRYNRETKKLDMFGMGQDDHANGGVSISGNGRVIAYHSYPPHVIRGQSPRVSEIYLEDLVHGDQIRLSRDEDVELIDGESINPQLDKKGRFVVFSSNASHLQPDTNNVFRSIFLFDRKSNDLVLVSRSDENEPGDRPSMEPKISSNGRIIGFKSSATNLNPPTPIDSLSYHLYYYDRRGKKLDRVDKKSYGLDPQKWRVGRFDFNSNGVLIVFEAFQKKVDDPQAAIELSDIFLFHRGKKEVMSLTENNFKGGANSPSISEDGRYVAFAYRGFDDVAGGIVVLDRKSGEYRKVLDGTCENPILSGNGEIIVFDSVDPKWRNESKGKDRHIYIVKNPFKD